MKQIIQQIPGYRVNEYQLVLRPPEDLTNKILLVKKEFAGLYQATQATWAKPHITLARFAQYEMMEERIMNRLAVVAMGYRPFKVELRDFGSFPTHTLFFQVTSREPIRGLVREIREAQRLMKLNEDNKPYFIDEPFITLAGKLKAWQYDKSWLEFAQRPFSGRFIADSMLLLKRRKGDKAYQALGLPFRNLPVATRQGELFANG
jgi:2'-5' RNA ligase